MSHFVYPGANHTRFEHSLGVMELATRVFDRVTRDDLFTDQIRERLPELEKDYDREYWRRALRMAALCHDLGHIPFSHAAEEELLPDGWDHERLTVELIRSDELRPIWEESPPLNPDEVARLAVGPEKFGDASPKNVEAILSEVITGDAFGVDRIDYLIRDSYHAGVAYGRFDHYRLIDTLRLLPPAPDPGDDSEEPTLGIEQGRIHSAEALLLARYFMFKQVYFHHVRRIYDIHLQEFMLGWLDGGQCSIAPDDFLALTDNEVMHAILSATHESDGELSALARRITRRQHFRHIYEPSAEDLDRAYDPGGLVFEALADHFGEPYVRRDWIEPHPDPDDEAPHVPEFTVLTHEGPVSSVHVSDVLADIPQATVDTVFVHPDIRGEAREWLAENKETVLRRNRGGETDESA